MAKQGATETPNILEIKDLKVSFHTYAGDVKALDGIEHVGEEGRAPRPGGRERLRQVRDHARGGRAAAAERRDTQRGGSARRDKPPFDWQGRDAPGQAQGHSDRLPGPNDLSEPRADGRVPDLGDNGHRPRNVHPHARQAQARRDRQDRGRGARPQAAGRKCAALLGPPDSPAQQEGVQIAQPSLHPRDASLGEAPEP